MGNYVSTLVLSRLWVRIGVQLDALTKDGSVSQEVGVSPRIEG
jgi:hypothetical protein